MMTRTRGRGGGRGRGRGRAPRPKKRQKRIPKGWGNAFPGKRRLTKARLVVLAKLCAEAGSGDREIPTAAYNKMWQRLPAWFVTRLEDLADGELNLYTPEQGDVAPRLPGGAGAVGRRCAAA